MDDIAKKIGDIAAHAAATDQTPEDIRNIVALEVDVVLKSHEVECSEYHVQIDHLRAALTEIAAHGEDGHAAFAERALAYQPLHSHHGQ